MSTGPASSPVNPGDILVGKYRVDRVLGMGAMGIVVAATHVIVKHRFAIKFMLANRNGAQELHDRFVREAQAAMSLKSERVTRVHEFGYLEGGAPYMVMEFLDGRDLAVLLQERGPLPIPEAVDYVLQTCEAVAEAHAAGIIHRDLKPANLFLTRGRGNAPCVKVIDFGISKLEKADHALTKTAMGMGSPLYMSREQWNDSKDVDGRADIWSLAVTLYELLAGSGNTPFNADTLPKLCTRVCMDAPTPLVSFRPDTPLALQAVLFRAMEKDRAHRWQNVGEFAAALAPFGSAHAPAYVGQVALMLGEALAPARPTAVLPAAPVGSVPAGGAVAGPGQALGTATTGGALTRPSQDGGVKRSGFVAGIAAGVVIAVLAAVGFVQWRTRGSAPATATSEAPSASAQAAPSVTPALVPSVGPAQAPSALPSAAPPLVTVAPGSTTTAAAPPGATAPSKVKVTVPPGRGTQVSAGSPANPYSDRN